MRRNYDSAYEDPITREMTILTCRASFKEGARTQCMQCSEAAYIDGFLYDLNRRPLTAEEKTAYQISDEELSYSGSRGVARRGTPAGSAGSILGTARVPSGDAGTEEAWKAEFMRDAAFRAEFGSVETFVAFKRAQKAGLVNIYGSSH